MVISKTISNLEKAYIAGLLDGDGSINISAYKSRHCLQIGISLIDLTRGYRRRPPTPEVIYWRRRQKESLSNFNAGRANFKQIYDDLVRSCPIDNK